MTKHQRRTQRYSRALPPWTPFERAVISRSEVIMAQRAYGMSDADVAVLLQGQFYRNSRYQVQVRYLTNSAPDSPSLPIVWLSIKRLDREPIFDWRDLQRIKNELVGPDCEGVQLFPAESRLVDTSNQYHIYVIVDATYRFPFGFQERLVMAEPGGKAKQRPFSA